MDNLIFDVTNGNCKVKLYKNGTRVVETIDPNATEIKLNQPLSLDINISNRCSNGCPYCYAGNTPTGKMADLLDMKYLDGVSGIEIAINIQYPLPENFKFWLSKMKDQNIAVSGTINQIDLERDPSIIEFLKELKQSELLWGIGISYRSFNKELYQTLKQELGNDIVVHTIVGVTPVDDIIDLLKHGFKVLILGYKLKERGIDYYKNFKGYTDEEIDRILNCDFNSVLAFDTAGLKQLNIEDKLSKEQWDKSFQGDEGTISFYIDAVNKTFNIDSHTCRSPYNIGNLTLSQMFTIIKETID